MAKRSEQIAFRLDAEILDRIDAYQAWLAEDKIRLSRTAVARVLLELGLDRAEELMAETAKKG